MPRIPALLCSLIAAFLAFGLLDPIQVSRVDAADVLIQEPLEPEIAEASNEPNESIAGIRLADGWKIGLYAAEPEVANIVAFDIDNQGRMYVCESFRQSRGVTDNRAHDDEWLLADLAAKTVQDRIDYHKRLLGDAAVTYAQHDDRIRRLSDTNGDGRIDESVVVAKGFNRIEEGTGAGILVRDNEIYYTCIPKLWKLVDQDRDGTIDEKVVMSDGYGVRVAFRGHDLHGLLIGTDGRLYFSIGDRGYHIPTDSGEVLANPAVGAVFRCELDGKNLEIFCNGLRNPQELAFNDLGDLFTVDNNSDSGDMARIVHLMQHGDTGWRMYYQYLPDRGPFNREKIWEPFHPEQPAYINPPIANFTDGPSGLAYYPGTGFGDTLDNRFLICDFRGGPSNSGIRSFQLDADGAFYKLGENDEPIWTVLATDVAFGPDGAMYVSDWVDGWEGLGKGRVYRITDPNEIESDIVREVQVLLGGDWKAREASDLINDLKHLDRRVRLEAQWELARRGEADPLLGVLIDNAAETTARLHAMWGVDQVIRNDNTQRKLVLSAVRDLLGSKDDVLRAAAAKFVGERGDESSAARLTELVHDTAARVRYFATMALGDLSHARAMEAVVGMLDENNNVDPALRHAGVMFLARSVADTEIAKLVGHANSQVRRAAIVALRRLTSPNLSDFLADPNPIVVAEAARAIHDEPVKSVMSNLAAIVIRDDLDAETMLRALNANYRMGTDAAAVALATHAAKESASNASRVEALDMLVDWANSDPRDRILNDHRPLPARDTVFASKALEAKIQRLMASNEAVREASVDAASKLGLQAIVPNLIERVADDERQVAERAGALTALARLDPRQAVAAAKKISMSPPTALAASALQVLADHDSTASIEVFVTATHSDGTTMRQLAWDILGGMNQPGDTVRQTMQLAITDYVAGKLPADVELNVLEAVEGKLDAKTHQQIADFQAELATTQPLAAWWPSRAGGDVDRGGKLFFGKTELSCVRCHKVDRAGGEVGPNLTVIGKDRDPTYLLESICLPNATIAKGYETAVIADEDGQVFTGIVKSETDEFVELIDANGGMIKIEQDAIEFRKKGQSSMPADLTKSMTARELRDMVAYLATLQVDPRAESDVE